jgi:hypothetical protein
LSNQSRHRIRLQFAIATQLSRVSNNLAQFPKPIMRFKPPTLASCHS